ncbi:MAG: YbjN domain-containing protein [Candidatus Freyarchaeota archaeon]|nr:YbjN domain-containing protein [Candidatus Jordarchaeia archaeon]
MLLDKVASLLDEAGLKYVKQKDAIVMHWETEYFSDLTVVILTPPDESWLFIVAWLTEVSNIPEEARSQLFYNLLKENFRQNGIKYGVDNDDTLFVSVETADTDMTSEEVKRYVLLLVNACDKFVELRKKLG